VVRSPFDWQPPPGTTIEQSYEAHNEGLYGRSYPVKYTAKCVCGMTSTKRASRADALEELDDHVHIDAVGIPARPIPPPARRKS
jgi:hypothetical protein